MKAPPEGTLRGVATFLATFGLGIATYIAIASAGGDAPVCLAGRDGCETIARSSYSHLLGVNVAVYGIVGYGLLLVCALLRGDGARMAGFALVLVGFGYTVFLTYVELFRVDAVCEWCLASAALMTLLFVTNTARMLGYVGREP